MEPRFRHVRCYGSKEVGFNKSWQLDDIAPRFLLGFSQVPLAVLELNRGQDASLGRSQ